jgi:hypothetical protein
MVFGLVFFLIKLKIQEGTCQRFLCFTFSESRKLHAQIYHIIGWYQIVIRRSRFDLLVLKLTIMERDSRRIF